MTTYAIRAPRLPLTSQTTTGDVVYQQNSSLAYVDSSGNAIMKVATDFVPYNEKRNSVKIQSQEGYGVRCAAGGPR